MKRRRTPLQLVFSGLGYVVLCAVALTMLFPFLWMVTTSLKGTGEAFSWPPRLLPNQIHLENYTRLFTLVPFGRYFVNSAIMTAGIVIGQLLICSLGAYAFARLNFMGRDLIFVLYLATMMVPYQVTLIPLFLMVYRFGWLDTFTGLIIPGISSVYGIFLLRQAFLSIPKELQDAARIDGCNEFGIYWRIFLPLNGPALATLGVFAFMGSWTDLLWPLLMSRSQDMRTLELGLAYFNTTAVYNVQKPWEILMAAAVVVLIPVLVVYFFTQKYFVKGIALSGIKG